MSRLRSCTSCSRHVYVSEAVCPFCQHALAAAPERVLPKLPNGLSRAQRFAMAAALTAPLAACADEPPDRTEPGLAGSAAEPVAADGGGGTGGDVGVSSESLIARPLYGAPEPRAGRKAPPPPYAGRGGPIVQPLYGAPVPPDDGGPVIHPLYGAPVPTAGEGGSGPIVQPLYGAPVPAAGAGGVGGDSGGPVVQPLYGAPLPAAGKGGSGGPIVQPLYGAPLPAAGKGGSGGPIVQPLYGAPAPVGGAGGEPSQPPAAGKGGSGPIFHPLYGAPLPTE